ncbi:AEC family transporter [soil metagenome]
MVSSALLLFPDFAMIALGLLLRRLSTFEDSFWSGLEKLVYFVLFPCLLFNSIVATRFDFAAAGSMLLAALAAIAAGALLGGFGRWWARDERVWASAFQCAFRFNSYIALAIAGRLAGQTGVATMAILIGVGVPVCNAMAVTALARHSEHGLLRELSRNPLLIATSSALLLNVAGIGLPEVLSASLKRAGDASIALGLIAVGAGLQLSAFGGSRRLVAWITAVKLLALPAIALGVGLALGLAGLQLQIAVLSAAMPTASSAYILAQRMGGDGRVVALLISIGTLLSAITVPAWLAIVS